VTENLVVARFTRVVIPAADPKRRIGVGAPHEAAAACVTRSFCDNKPKLVQPKACAAEAYTARSLCGSSSFNPKLELARPKLAQPAVYEAAACATRCMCGHCLCNPQRLRPKLIQPGACAAAAYATRSWCGPSSAGCPRVAGCPRSCTEGLDPDALPRRPLSAPLWIFRALRAPVFMAIEKNLQN
jgi:hypothetical protein